MKLLEELKNQLEQETNEITWEEMQDFLHGAKGFEIQQPTEEEQKLRELMRKRDYNYFMGNIEEVKKIQQEIIKFYGFDDDEEEKEEYKFNLKAVREQNKKGS